MCPFPELGVDTALILFLLASLHFAPNLHFLGRSGKIGSEWPYLGLNMDSIGPKRKGLNLADGLNSGKDFWEGVLI